MGLGERSAVIVGRAVAFVAAFATSLLGHTQRVHGNCITVRAVLEEGRGIGHVAAAAAAEAPRIQDDSHASVSMSNQLVNCKPVLKSGGAIPEPWTVLDLLVNTVTITV